MNTSTGVRPRAVQVADPIATGGLTQLGAELASRPYARRGVTMSEEMIRVLIVGDHALVREGLHALLRSAPDVDVVGDIESGGCALTLAKRLSPAVVILDLDLPEGTGKTALREFHQAIPSVRVLILTICPEHEQLVPLLEAGARGYLTKKAASADLVEAIRVIAAGEVYVRPTAARLLAAAIVPHSMADTARERFRTLSEREQTIVRMVAQGYSGVEVARTLGISTKTVDAYKHRVQDKLGLAHRTMYVSFAIEAGILAS